MKRLETLKDFGLSLGSTLILFFGGLALPVIGVLALPFASYPALYLGVKAGSRGIGQVLPFLVAPVVYFVAGRDAALGYVLLGMVSVSLLSVFGRGWSIAVVVSASALGTLAVLLCVLLVLTGSFPSLWNAVYRAVNAQVLLTVDVYENLGISGETVEFLRTQSTQIATMFTELLPSLLFFVCVVVALANLAVLSYHFRQFRSFFFILGDIKEWKSPDHLVWLFVVPGLSLFLPLPWLIRMVAVNLVLVCSVFYFFHGLAIIAYYFHYKRVPMVFRIAGYVLIVFEQFLTLLVIGLGFFDLWGDFRRLKRAG